MLISSIDGLSDYEDELLSKINNVESKLDKFKKRQGEIKEKLKTSNSEKDWRDFEELNEKILTERERLGKLKEREDRLKNSRFIRDAESVYGGTSYVYAPLAENQWWD